MTTDNITTYLNNVEIRVLQIKSILNCLISSDGSKSIDRNDIFAMLSVALQLLDDLQMLVEKAQRLKG